VSCKQSLRECESWTGLILPRPMVSVAIHTEKTLKAVVDFFESITSYITAGMKFIFSFYF